MENVKLSVNIARFDRDGRSSIPEVGHNKHSFGTSVGTGRPKSFVNQAPSMTGDKPFLNALLRNHPSPPPRKIITLAPDMDSSSKPWVGCSLFPEWTLPDSDELSESDQIGTKPRAAVEGIPAVTFDSKGLHESTLHGGCKKSTLGPGKIGTVLSNFSEFGLNNQCNFDGMLPSNGASRLDGLSRMEESAFHTTEDSENHGGGEQISEENQLVKSRAEVEQGELIGEQN
ncbi:hypothetical protein L1987_53415 [Smallanthus sonchifolius]|uniref:Uncharacterized protein n=1 Tax=Smallanthus sonchifolius TaxID=185202 RepID=A0ACB9EW72_9ASTR|nr:hypothetical protein L1987_53415 [Smallanthus sonchifolius]